MRKIHKNNIFIIILMLGLLAAFGFYVNRDIEIKALYMDDLYMWSCYGEQSILEFAFPVGTSTRFRPVYWLAVYLQMALVGHHVSMFAVFNIAVNILVSWELFFMARGLFTGNITGTSYSVRKSADTVCRSVHVRGSIAEAAGCVTAAAVGACYLASRFAYYQIGQVLGLMETMALAMAAAVLYLLLGYCTRTDALTGEAATGNCDDCCAQSDVPDHLSGHFYAALILWFLLVFVHERYLSLFALFYLALIVRAVYGKLPARIPECRYGAGAKSDAIIKSILPIILLVLIIIIRTLAVGDAVPAGTGGTYVTETFSLSQAMGFCVDQILYIFGVNAGPEYLCGIEWGQTPAYIKRTIKLSVLFIGIVCIIFSILFIKKIINYVKIKNRVSLDTIFRDVAAVLMTGAFMALCIGCSSVTIRLELRWIYVSYAAALLLAAYMAGAIFREGIEAGIVSLAAFTIYAGLSIYANIFCRGYFYRIYFWQDQLRMNSLAEETIEKYGRDNVFGRNIYIVGNSYGMSDFYAEYFFKPFDPEKKAEGTVIIFAEDIEAVPAEEAAVGRALVLEEVPEEDAYRDITQEISVCQDTGTGHKGSPY